MPVSEDQAEVSRGSAIDDLQTESLSRQDRERISACCQRPGRRRCTSASTDVHAVGEYSLPLIDPPSRCHDARNIAGGVGSNEQEHHRRLRRGRVTRRDGLAWMTWLRRATTPTRIPPTAASGRNDVFEPTGRLQTVMSLSTSCLVSAGPGSTKPLGSTPLESVVSSGSVTTIIPYKPRNTRFGE